jgi:hypothetical protein
MATEEDKRAARTELAKGCIQKACKSGEKIGGADDISRILLEKAELYGGREIFNCISFGDLAVLHTDCPSCANAIHTQQSKNSNNGLEAPVNLPPGHFPPTPEQTPTHSEQGSEVHSEPDRGTGDAKGQPIQPGESDVIGDVNVSTAQNRDLLKCLNPLQAKTYDISIYHPKQGEYDLLCGIYGTQKPSYISVTIITRFKLTADPPRGQVKEQTVRLCWSEQGDQRTKRSKSTRFRVVDSDRMTHDIVIGTAFEAHDESENEDDQDEYQESEQLGNEGDETFDDGYDLREEEGYGDPDFYEYDEFDEHGEYYTRDGGDGQVYYYKRDDFDEGQSYNNPDEYDNDLAEREFEIPTNGVRRILTEPNQPKALGTLSKSHSLSSGMV